MVYLTFDLFHFSLIFIFVFYFYYVEYSFDHFYIIILFSNIFLININLPQQLHEDILFTII